MDWKMKFLALMYREGQDSFFGKKGIPWQGLLIMAPRRVPITPAQRASGESEFECGVYDAYYYNEIMDDNKEDGAAALVGFFLAMKAFCADGNTPFVNWADVKTDARGPRRSAVV
jgi:hypothetical protein